MVKINNPQLIFTDKLKYYLMVDEIDQDDRAYSGTSLPVNEILNNIFYN